MLIPKRTEKRISTSSFYLSEIGRNVNATKCKTGRITYRWSLFIKQANDAVEIIKINDRTKYSLYLVIENIFEVK